MKTQNINVIFLYTLLTIVVASCQLSRLSTTEIPSSNNIKTGNCLSPIYENFSYPVSENNKDILIPRFNINIPPSDSWQVISSLPEIEGMSEWHQRFIDVIQTRYVNGYSEIWVYLSRGLEEGYLARYKTNTNQWEIFPNKINELFVTQDDMLWSSNLEGTILSKYQESTKTFIPEIEIADILSVAKEGNHYYSDVLIDDEDVFWILVPQNGIYKYNPITKQKEKIFELLGDFDDAQINSDGVIYVLSTYEETQNNQFGIKSLLIAYDTKTNTIDTLDLMYILEPYPYPQTLLIDHLGHIWLDNIAYKDEIGNWYQIQRSPIFISPIKEVYSDYRFKRADIVLESSDGRLWFKHQNGMVFLNPEKGEWCWFTTYQSNIVEDSDRNLWMIADNKLYKLPLGEQ